MKVPFQDKARRPEAPPLGGRSLGWGSSVRRSLKGSASNGNEDAPDPISSVALQYEVVR